MKKIETKKRGSYGIVTLAIREPLFSILEWYCKDNEITRSSAIRDLIKHALKSRAYSIKHFDKGGKLKNEVF